VLEGDHITLADLKSSWAGAMGQPQFLPSKFLDFAVDFDGDGKRDIWNSVPDSLASIANFLKGHGWNSGVAWGAEITEKSAPACTWEGPDQGAPLSVWISRGAQPAHGRLPASLKPEAFLLMPAGTAGPAFLVSQNFYVLKSYNNSDLYALFIGQLADRLHGGSPIAGDWAPVGGFDRGDVQGMQLRLQKRGVNVGKPDGLVGFRTRVAVGNWQAENGVAPTCFPDAALVGCIR
jgi:membrane-bound lytic murein transglycosylase B